MADSSITVRFKGDTASLDKGISQAESGLKQFESVTSNAIGNIRKNWKSLALGVASVGVAFQTVKGAVDNYIIAPLAKAVTSFTATCDGLAKMTQYLLDILSFGAKVGAVVAAFALLKSSILLVTAGIGMLKTAMVGLNALVMKNPMLASVLAVSVALAGLYEVFKKVNSAALDAAKSSADAANAVSEAARKQTEAMKDAATADQGLLDRLKELAAQAEKDPLMKGEIEEAQDLVATLTDRYGDLGLAVDSTTGKITGLATAQDKMLATQKQMMQLQLEKELADVEQEMRDIDKVFKEAGSTIDLNTIGTAAENLWSSLFGDGTQVEASSLTDLEDQYGPRVTALMKRKGQLQGDLAKADPTKYADWVEEDLSGEVTEITEGEVKTNAELDAMAAENKSRKAFVESHTTSKAEVDKRLAEAQADYDASKERYIKAKRSGNPDTFAAAKDVLAGSERNLNEVRATVSGEVRDKARQDRDAAEKAYDEGVAGGKTTAELATLWQAVEESRKRADAADAEYSSAVDRLEEPKAWVQYGVYDALAGGKSTGTFSAFGIEGAIGENTVQQQMLDTLLKLLTTTKEIKEEKQGEGFVQ